MTIHARFTQGSIMRHVIEMTLTGTIGLVAIFFVDAVNLFYIGRLGDLNLTAAVGFASTLLFMLTSVSIGFVIAGTALVSRRLGAQKRDSARRIAASSLVWIALCMMLATVLLLVGGRSVLALMGAQDKVLDLAVRYLAIVMPSSVLLGLGMMYGGILRAVGDARRAMWVTLSGGIVTAMLDPLLIFGLGLGLDGAAIAAVTSRVIFAIVGYHGAVRVHNMVARPTRADTLADTKAIADIAVPAVLTNVATPVGIALGTRVFSSFGPEVIAGLTVIDRLVPLVFGIFFALTGAVGPIIGQNLGARKIDRVQRTITDSLICIAGYSLIACTLLALFATQIADVFGVSGEARRVVIFYCRFGAIGFAFIGGLFVANASFNNLGHPLYATVFNWGRALIGNVPFALAGIWLAGTAYAIEGALLGIAVGSMIFAVIAVIVCFRLVRRLHVPPSPA